MNEQLISQAPPLYKFVGAEGAISILRNHRLRFTAGHLLNDPLEFVAERFCPPAGPEFGDALRHVVRSLLTGAAVSSHSGMAEAVAKCRRQIEDGAPLEDAIDAFHSDASHNNQLLYKAHNDGLLQRLSCFRVCSATDCHDCALLWSLYGQGFKGAVVTLDPLLRVRNEYISPTRVRYTDRRENLQGILPSEWANHLMGVQLLDMAKFRQRILYSKPSAYSIEREWRFVINVHADKEQAQRLDTPISLNQVRAISYGCRMNPDDAREIHRLVSGAQTPIRLYQASPSLDSPSKIRMTPVPLR